ncbi:Fur family transcriptional regulator [Candidatus Margulisiibacteriota bacterium]
MSPTVIEKLKAKGVKVTPQRVAIIEYLEKNYDHPSAEDIYKVIKKNHPGVSFATIYNTLDKLAELNEILKLKIAEDRVHYEYHTGPHHHFYCRKCQKIYDIKVSCPHLDTLKVGPHRLEEVHGYFKGVCKDCLKK